MIERRRWGALSLALPRLEALDLVALAITLVAAAMPLAARQSLLRTLAVAGALGLLRAFA